jgi:hypothetical protein
LPPPCVVLYHVMTLCHWGPCSNDFASLSFGRAALRRPFGTGSSGPIPLVGVSSLGGCCRSCPICHFGDRWEDPTVLSSGRFSFGSRRLRSPRPLLDVSISLTGPFLGSAREPGPHGSLLRVGLGSAFGQALRSRLPAGEGCPGLRIWSPRSSREPGKAFAGLRTGEHRTRFVLAEFKSGFTPAACRGWHSSVDIFG